MPLGVTSARRRRLAGAIGGLGLLLAPAGAITTSGARPGAPPPAGHAARAPDHPLRSGGGPRMRSGAVIDAGSSSNWSGLGGTGRGIEGAEGHWTVPAVGASGPSGHSSSWVGVDGLEAGDPNLIQAGTEQDTNGAYYAWWEILPHAAVRIVSAHGRAAPVRPGDEITALVQQTAQRGIWTIYLHDLSQGWYFEQATPYTGAGRSAEWIEEAPTVGAGATSLPDFGSVTFSGLAIYGQFGTSPGWYSTDLGPANEIVLRGRPGTSTSARPSGPSPASAGGQQFSDLALAPPA